MAERISAADFTEKVLGSRLPVIVEFYSDSCVACKKLSPVLAEAEEEYEGRVIVYKVNTGYDADLAERYGVRANPTLIAYLNGDIIDRSIGAVRKDELHEFMDRLIG